MINACVGPNGDVYPCQSYFESLGNILTDAMGKNLASSTCRKTAQPRDTWKKNAKIAGNCRFAAADAPWNCRTKTHECNQTG